MRLNNSTTHVICSEKNWKVEHPTVLAAIKLDDAKTKTKLSSNSNDSKKLNIVTWDWLEDCTIKRRCYGAKKYEWRTPMRKPSRLEELIRQWGEITGVEMSPRLVYGPGGKGASFNGNVKGSSKVKRKGNEKGKGKTLSLVEKDLVKGIPQRVCIGSVETDHNDAAQPTTASTAKIRSCMMWSSRSSTP